VNRIIMDTENDIGPLLKNLKRDHPFTVPEGYFEAFPGRLEQAIQHARPVHKKMNVRVLLAAASIAAAMLLSATLLFRHQYRQGLDARFHAEISRTVDMELYSISEETILEAMAPETNSGTVQKAPAEEGQVIEYLLQEDLDEADLLNAL
jgi:hypothetical protein